MKSLFQIGSRLQNRVHRTLSDAFGRRVLRARNAFPVISFTFDDFPASALRVGGAILQRYGATATYYTALGLMNTDGQAGRLFSLDDLCRASADGHELGCHTFAHCHAWKTGSSAFEQSIVKNQERLADVMPGTAFRTFSYPLSEPRPTIKRKAEKYFLCCRGGGQTFNAGPVDLNNLRGFFLEQSRECPARAKDMIDRACDACGWLIFATHDVSEQPSRFGCTPEFFKEIVRHAAESGATILPVAKAYEVVCGSPAAELALLTDLQTRRLA